MILYTSSRENVLNTSSNQNNKYQKRSKCRRMALKNSVVDLRPMQILRKSRSTFSNKARPLVWGHRGNILADLEENRGTDNNLDKKNKVKRVRGGKGENNFLRDQGGRELIGKRCIPIGQISLKIRIGNQVCSMDNATEKFTAEGEDVPEFGDTLEYRLRELPEVVVSPHERKLEKAIPSEASVLSTHVDIKSAYDKPSFKFSDDDDHMIITEGVNNFGAAFGNLSSDLGTSPNSEVIISVPDAVHCENGLSDKKTSPISSKMSISSSNFSSLNLLAKKSKKGNEKYELHPVGKYTLKIKLAGSESSNNAKVPFPVADASCLSIRQAKFNKDKKKNKVHEVDECSRKGKKTVRETRNVAGKPADHGVGQNTADAVTIESYSNRAETNLCSEIVTTVESSKSQLSNMSIPCINGQKFTECSKGKAGSNDRSRVIDLPAKKDKITKKQRNKNNETGEHLAHEKVDANGIVREVERRLIAGNQTASDLNCRTLSNDLTLPDCVQVPASGVRKQFIPKRNAWVLCDECQKWRRITATLADQIEETNCGWTCKENTDRDFSDCSVPQEKSNSAINEELELSEASCEEDACDSVLKSINNRPKAPQQSSWSLITSNLFQHRSRKMQTIDEVMVCHCKPPSDGRMGCGAKCLNRMLNIECIQGTCPSGDLCSNQQFQKRKYAKLKWFKCGKKGYGLLAREGISQGQFLIEYVGEVLDMHAYEARQREYGFNGQRHFYFMTLNGNEVIDACAKGNLARFINHSCDPNCRTEKWMVNGEVCVGLFALRDIKKGEEVTFDYNYVRVSGAAAKKCVCGAPNCHGFIGGDATNSEVTVQDDSDYEFSEPVMTCEDRELNEDWREIIYNSEYSGENDIGKERLENKYSIKELVRTVGDDILKSHTPESLTDRVAADVYSTPVEKTVDRDILEVGISVGDDSMESWNTNKVNNESSNGPISTNFKVDSESLESQMHSSQFGDMPSLTGGVSNKAMASANSLVGVTASSSISLPDTVECKRKLKYATMGGRDELAKSNPLAKSNSLSSSIRKGKPKASVINDKGTQKTDQLSAALKKTDKLPELKVKSHSETVEKTLNELLDLEGGISKQKDASKGYLKLLFLTAASGNNGHGEAIQSNRDLSMILDALMKTKSQSVLVDIINQNGLQMLHNIMKRYRKDFMKTPILRKLLKVLEHLAWREILTMEHITGGPPCAGVESFKDSMLLLTEHADRQVHHIARNFRDRWIPRSLRKSFCMKRDDPMRQHNQHRRYSVFSTVAVRSTSSPGETASSDISVSGSTRWANGANSRKRRSRWDEPAVSYHSRPKTNSRRLNSDEYGPPGFSCSKVPCDASSTGIHHREIQMLVKPSPGDIISGHPQQRFATCTPVSYGVPYSTIQQFGVRADSCETVYPAVPFHPFPPLPLHRHEDGDRPSTATVMANKHSDDDNTSDGNRHPDFQQGDSCSLGRKYFDNKKCDHSKSAMPLVQMTNDCGSRC